LRIGDVHVPCGTTPVQPCQRTIPVLQGILHDTCTTLGWLGKSTYQLLAANAREEETQDPAGRLAYCSQCHPYNFMGTHILPSTLEIFQVRPHPSLVFFYFPTDWYHFRGVRNPLSDSRRDGPVARCILALKLAHAGMCSLDTVVRDTDELWACG